MITDVPGVSISSNNDDDLLSAMDIAAIAITAVVGIPLLLLFMIMLIRRMKNKSRKINTNDKNAVIIKLPSQSGVANDDCKFSAVYKRHHGPVNT